MSITNEVEAFPDPSMLHLEQLYYSGLSMKSAVSVIIPTYNQSRLLTETVESILAQTYAPAEIIVLDDGSTDNTAEVVRGMPSVVKYYYKPNGGICAARNSGASFATSPYLAFCDHDDLWRPDKLAKQMRLHLERPDLQYSFTDFAIVSEGKWSTTSKFAGAPKHFFDGCESISDTGMICGGSMYERLLEFQPIWPSTIVITRGLFDSLGGFNESFGKNPSEDLEFTLRCLQRGSAGVIAEPVVGVRKHLTNYSGSNYRNTLGQLEILKYALDHHTILEQTKDLVRLQINLRRVDASYSAFELEEFGRCRQLLSGVPSVYLTPKVRLKKFISSLPQFMAKRLHSLLVRR